MLKSLAIVEEHQLAANTQVLELTHSVNRLTSVIQNLYERMSTQSPERYLTSPPAITDGFNLTITNGNNQSEEEQNIVKPWSNVVTTLDSCDIDSFYMNIWIQKLTKHIRNSRTTQQTNYVPKKQNIPRSIQL